MPITSPAPITEDALRRLLADPDTPDEEIAKYLQLDERESGMFAPSVVVNPDLVTGGALEGAVLLGSLNGISRRRRAVRYRRKIQNFNGLKIISEGDSWFQYPFLLKDVIDQLMEQDNLAILSLGAAGDLIDDMIVQDEVVSAAVAEGADAVLLSGGGNDLLGDGRLAQAVRTFDASLSPAEHLTQAFEDQLSRVLTAYADLMGQLVSALPDLKIFCHSYDYARPAQGRWLGKPMEKKGITDPTFQAEIVRVMIDRFHAGLTQLVARPALASRVTLVDCRTVVQPDQWFDELHPRNPGYDSVARRFLAAIDAAFRPSPSGALESARAPDAPGAIVAMAERYTLAQLESALGQSMMVSSLEGRMPTVGAGMEDGLRDRFRDVARPLIARAHREIHALLCGDGAAHSTLRKKLKDALGISDRAITDAIVDALVLRLGLAVGPAGILAAILFQVVIKPMAEEGAAQLCAWWADNLPPEPV